MDENLTVIESLPSLNSVKGEDSPKARVQTRVEMGLPVIPCKSSEVTSGDKDPAKFCQKKNKEGNMPQCR
jgi:hypothetical protein